MPESSEPHQPVVLLGASNLTLGWSDLINVLSQQFDDPLDVVVAAGMGRSYLKWSRFLARRLPAIGDCGLWDALPPVVGRSHPPAVLITDVGNDLVYGFRVQEILDAVSDCVQRLRHLSSDCRVVLTGLPGESIDELSNLRYGLFRRILFPGLELPLSEIRSLSHELNAGLRQLAADLGLPLFSPQRSWYGFDPIHLRRSVRRTAFAAMIREWGLATAEWNPGSAGRRRWRLPKAAERVVWGRPRSTVQPCQVTDNVRVFAY